MASTETRSGFRLPWSTDRNVAVDSEGVDDAAPAEVSQPTGEIEAPESETSPEMLEIPAAPDTEMSTEATAEADVAPAPANDDPATPALAAPAPAAPVRPTKFLADLTRAMCAAAEAERAELVRGLQDQAKGFVEEIRQRSTSGAAELRTLADGDIVGIREWSKAEIARIREETERRIAARRADLDEELESHAAAVEREVELVNGAVATYEARMERFFESLLAEEDPTRFAALAANLPAPPDLDAVARGTAIVERAAPWADDPTPVVEPIVVQATTDPVTAEPVASIESPTDTDATADGVEEATTDIGWPTVDRRAPIGGGPASTDDTAAAEPEDEAAAEAAEPDDDARSDHAPDAGTIDPRVAALGLTPDFASAEAEALADAGTVDDGSDDAEIPVIDDDTIAARLSGLGSSSTPETMATQVVVTGLMSVASIAGFKRQLAGIPGVRSVGVSSGPDGEFVYTVQHGPEVSLGDAVPTLHGFAARVTTTGDGIVSVAARDPEADG